MQRDRQDELVKAFQKHYNAFFPQGALDSPLFGSIVSELHHLRLSSLLARTKGEIVLQGRIDVERRRFEPTIVKDVVDGDSLLEESVLPCVERYDPDQDGIYRELFGPILPIVPVDSLKQAIDFVNARQVSPVTTYLLVELSAQDLIRWFCTPLLRTKASSNDVCFTFLMMSQAKSLTKVVAETQSGNIVFNDTFQQLAGMFLAMYRLTS